MARLDATVARSERDCRLFAGVQASVTSARRFVVEALGQIPKPLLEAIELMVSELASNCVLHTSAEFEVCIVSAERTVRVEVTDTGRGLPVLRQPVTADLRGRGLVIVKELADEWGVVPQAGETGKTVWFSVRRP
jgi:anti-sigma regulatory factor (Ser/Thr protein kinase)